MQQTLEIGEIILGVMLVTLIMLQSKGTGIGSTFGGDMGFYATKRGAEKMMFIATMVISTLFLIIPIIGLMVG